MLSRFVFRPLLALTALSSAPVFAATPTSKPAPAVVSQAGWNFQFAEDALEKRWSFRGQLSAGKSGEMRVVFGWKDAQNTGLLRVVRAGNSLQATLSQMSGGRTIAAASGFLARPKSALTLQKVGNRVRVLADGVLLTQLELPGGLADNAETRLGWAAQGDFKFDAGDVQPTEEALLRDDFMRAEGPNDAEIPGVWQTVGSWKTSGALGPKSDAALNPNPFVFRAEGASENSARAGKWWWSDYSISASVRANQTDARAPLQAAIEAFAGDGAGIRGEVDFSRGVAVLKSGSKILAQSAPFEVETGSWHRLRLNPGPGTAQFVVDGVVRASAPVQRAQGEVVLRAVAGGGNQIDFDDVRVGALSSGMALSEWGEGALPSRFQTDRLMRNWASAASAWKRDASGIWWHTGDFFGDAKLDMTLPPLEVGDGFEVFLSADAKNPKTGLRYQISRPGAKTEALASFDLRSDLRSDSRQTARGAAVSLSGAAMPLHFALTRLKSGAVRVQSSLGTLNLVKNWAPSNWKPGTQIGFRPLKNGQPLPPAQLQSLDLASKTFEREGRTVVGVNITPVSTEIARVLGLPDAFGAVVDNVEADSPARRGGLLEGDVIRGIDGARVTDVDSMRAAVGAVKAGDGVRLEILRPQSNSAGLDLSQCLATTPQMLDYSFTAAPVDWRAASGTWNVAERWTCSPQWSFFAGQGDISPVLWSRFATAGDWTLEAYLATPMDLTRSERGPSDLNLSVGGDGAELSSGYSFLFSAKNRSVNQIRRGDAVAWEKPFEMPPTVGDTHQDWFYVRLEKRQSAAGARFRFSVNGRELANYLDPKPLPDGGHFAFWTQNGALSIARVRLWESGLRAAPVAAMVAAPLTSSQAPMASAAMPKLQNGLGIWSARGTGREASAQIVLAAASKNEAQPMAAQPMSAQPTVKIVNPRSGGDWTTYVTRRSFKPGQMPTLEWDYRVPDGVKVNLYALVDSSWREIEFTGGAGEESTQLGRVAGVVADDKWHHARFDIAGALRQKNINADTVDALAFAAPAHDYLRSGLGGNHRGAAYWLRDFRAGAVGS